MERNSAMHMELKARAKINLSLDVIGKRPDGYHNVEMIMQTVELHDKIHLRAIRYGIRIECNCPWIPKGPGNIAFKAASLLIKEAGIKSGIEIRIDKKIPVTAGLAGGSSDAAAVIRGMNSLFSLDLSKSDLMAIGRQIGADVPYCIKGGTVLARGIGEILTGLKPLPKTDIILVKPRIGVSTEWAYKNLDLDNIKDRPDTSMLVAAITDGKIDLLAGNMKNVLESVTIEKYNVIGEIKTRLMELGAMGSIMSGSGPTVFGMFSDKEKALYAYNNIKNQLWDCYITQTI